MKKYLKKFIYPAILSVVVWALLFFTRIGEQYYVLESIWVTGIIVILQSLLFWVSGEGVFNTITWGFARIADLFRKEPKLNMKYFEYVETKREKAKVSPIPSLIIGGLLFLIGTIWWLIIK